MIFKEKKISEEKFTFFHNDINERTVRVDVKLFLLGAVGNCSHLTRLKNFSNTGKSALFFYDADSRKVRYDRCCIDIRY